MASDSRRFTLRGKLALALFVAALSGAVLTGLATLLAEPWWVAAALALIVLVPVVLWTAQLLATPLREVLRALTAALASFRDGDFSGSIRVARSDELGELIEAHNELGSVLRAERHDLVQRELMLDTVVQNTPTALVLCDAADHIVYGNVAARQQFNAGRKLEGLSFAAVLAECDAAVRTAVAARQDAIFSVALEGAEESFHLAQRDFSLRARPHRLYVFRRLTRELGRQEVATWKKAIRVISHELNNALAPISSLAHSGRELARLGERDRLERVFDTIEDRSRYLHSFLQGYAAFAKLPLPRSEAVRWREFLDGLAAQYRYRAGRARAGRDRCVRPRPDGAGVLERAQERARVGLRARRRRAGAPRRGTELARRRARSRLGMPESVPDPGPAAVLLDQAHRHRPRARAGARDHRGARRPRRAREPRGRGADGHAVVAEIAGARSVGGRRGASGPTRPSSHLMLHPMLAVCGLLERPLRAISCMDSTSSRRMPPRRGPAVAGVEAAAVLELEVRVVAEEVRRADGAVGARHFLCPVVQVGEREAPLARLLLQVLERVLGVVLGVVRADRDDTDPAAWMSRTSVTSRSLSACTYGQWLQMNMTSRPSGPRHWSSVWTLPSMPVSVNGGALEPNLGSGVWVRTIVTLPGFRRSGPHPCLEARPATFLGRSAPRAAARERGV
jgi:PAS domain-containing protein